MLVVSVLILYFIIDTFKGKGNGNKIVFINKDCPLLLTKLIGDVPDVKGGRIFGYDLNKDGKDEMFTLIEKPKSEFEKENHLKVLKKEGRRYGVVTDFLLCRGYLSDLKLVDLTGNGSYYLVENVSSGGSAGYFTTYIISYNGNYKIADSSGTGPYGFRFDDLDKSPPKEIISMEFVAGSGCNADKVYINRIYRWDGNAFIDSSNRFPDYYSTYIDKMKVEITQSIGTDKGWDVGYVDDRTKGIIMAWRLSNSSLSKMDPEETVKRYFEFVHAKDYAIAYSLLSNKWHNWKSYGLYTFDLSNAEFTMVVKSIELKKQFAEKKIVIAELRYNRLNGEYIKSEKLRYTLVKEDEIWKIDKGELVGKPTSEK